MVGKRRSDGRWSCAQTRELAERTVKGRVSRRSTSCRKVSVISHKYYNGKGEDIPMGFRSDQFGDCVCESRERADVKDGERVFSVIHATRREDDGDEM